ncbi:MAG: amidohydrolase family protein [bacterium]
MTTDRLYIDSYAMVGKRGPKDVEAACETNELLEEMAWCGIQGALIAHSVAKEYDPIYGNRLLVQELKKSKRLFGVWTVMPHHTREFPRPADTIKEMNDHGMAAAKMYPRLQRYPFTIDFCGELLRELEKHQILLMVEGGHFYQPDLLESANQVLFSELDAVLSSFPNLKVLLQASRWDATRYLHRLMMKHKNLHFELSTHQGNRAVELFADWYGADRILFGTGALEKSPGAAKAFVDYCTLSDGQKQSIASGNIIRLAGINRRLSDNRATGKTDPILVQAKAGKPLKNLLVIDSHAHIAHEGAEGIGTIHMPYSDAKSMVDRAALMGIDTLCVSSFLAIWADYQLGNKIVRDAMKLYPSFYVGYASLQPQYIKDWPRELSKVHRKFKMKGMKPYFPRTNIPYNDKLWSPWYEYGNRISAFALIHPSPNVVAEVNDIAPKFPNIAFIIAHCGGSFQDARKGVEMALKNPNVYLEITLTAVTYRVIEFMVHHVGADRVLFGTDQPMRDPLPQFGWMAYSHCSTAEKKKMFGLNMQKIIKRVKV